MGRHLLRPMTGKWKETNITECVRGSSDLLWSFSLLLHISAVHLTMGTAVSWLLRGRSQVMDGHFSWFFLHLSALTIFWLYYLLRLPKFRWDAIWFPFGPLCGAGTCLYVDHTLEESSEEVKQLRNYMFAYKAR